MRVVHALSAKRTTKRAHIRRSWRFWLGSPWSLCQPRRARASVSYPMGMPRFSRFGEVADLDDESLRALLRGDGDEPERVWAAWALAIRGKAGGKLFDETAKQEPSPGVRAHLALMLVASGERAAALVLARRDPNVFVRESAWRYVARTATPGDDALNDALAASLSMDPAPSVRAAILDGLPDVVSAYVRDRAVARLDDDSLEVCAAAVDFIMRRDDEDLVRLLLARARSVADDALFRKMIGACTGKLVVRELLDAVVSWSPHETIRLLDALVAANVALSTADVESLFERDAALDVYLATLDAKRVIELPLRRVLEVAVRRSFYVAERLIARLDAAGELAVEEHALVRELIESIEREYEAQEPEVPVVEALARVDDWDDVPWIPELALLPALWRARDRR